MNLRGIWICLGFLDVMERRESPKIVVCEKKTEAQESDNGLIITRSISPR